MASQIVGFMRAKASMPPVEQPLMPSLATRHQRRRAARLCAEEAERIRDAEDAYRERIPENLASKEAYCIAEEAIAALDQAAEFLREAL
jgi:hypothetical protein